MTRTLVAAALLLPACAPEAGVEGQDAGALYELVPTNPLPLPRLEICGDHRDNDGDGMTDEAPCRTFGGYAGGSDDGSSIHESPEDVRVPYSDDVYTVAFDRETGDLDVTVGKDLVGILELSERVGSAHLVTVINDDRSESIALVLDIDVSKDLNEAFVIDRFEGVWTTEGIPFDGQKR